MKATIILIPRIEAQIAAGETEIIDPAGVRVRTDMPWPLFRNMSYKVPEDVVGSVRRVWLENGQLMAEIEIDFLEVAYGGMRTTQDGPMDLMSVGIVPSSKRP